MPTSELFAHCYVRLPARPASIPEDGWDAALLAALPYALTDSDGAILRSGHADPVEIPAARETTLIVDARDVLLLRLQMPAVNGARLREVLPGLLEERLLGDPEDSHFAVLKRHENNEASIAAADRAWLRFILDAFGQRRLHLVPAALCVPLAEDRATVVVEALPADLDAPRWRLTIRTSLEVGYGMTMPASTAPQWLASRLPVATVYADESARPALGDIAIPAAWPLWIDGVRKLGGIDMCQFELAHARRRVDTQGAAARWRWPIALGAAAILICLTGVNAQWLWLAHQQHALRGEMQAVLHEHFPNVTPIVDAPMQMRQQLALLARSKGQPTAGDMADLSDRFARALGPVPKDAITELSYRDRTLRARLAEATKVDTDALRKRLEAAGLTARQEEGQWSIRIRS